MDLKKKCNICNGTRKIAPWKIAPEPNPNPNPNPGGDLLGAIFLGEMI